MLNIEGEVGDKELFNVNDVVEEGPWNSRLTLAKMDLVLKLVRL